MSKKNNYYVLVLSNEGAVFVTHINNKSRYSVWDKKEKPLRFNTKTSAEDVAYGLCMNGYQAFAISFQWEIEGQPYLYNKGHFEWVWDNEKEN